MEKDVLLSPNCYTSSDVSTSAGQEQCIECPGGTGECLHGRMGLQFLFSFSSNVLRKTSVSIYISPLPNTQQSALRAKVVNFIQCHRFRTGVSVKSIALKTKRRLICLVGVMERHVLGGCSLDCLKKSCVLSMRRNAKAMNGASVTV